MSFKYLTTETIKESCRRLSNQTFDNESILHIFLILKYCNFNDLERKSISVLSESGYPAAFMLGSLFSPNEKHPDRYDFINPFKLSNWASQPSEILKKWFPSRVLNNINGGARTWRRIVDYNPDDETIRLRSNYIDSVKDLTVSENKIDLSALATWALRNNPFDIDQDISSSTIIDVFKDLFNLNAREIDMLFDVTRKYIKPIFISSPYDPATIRRLIGSPSDEGWYSAELSEDEFSNELIINERIIKMSRNNITLDSISDAIEMNKNIILSGPPATSKSYYAKKIAESYDESRFIQFHPEYTYQEFIGGYFVEGDSVQFVPGVLIELSEKAKSNPDKKFLLVIDEINRGNVSSIFGETIQCLDRGYDTEVKIGNHSQRLSLPTNLHILATRNTSDRSLANIDLAIYRRFYDLTVEPNEDQLDNTTETDSDISLKDLLIKVNHNLNNITKDKELEIGQAVFYIDTLLDNGKYHFNNDKLHLIFKYSILPLIKQYCFGDENKVISVLGEPLYNSIQSSNSDNFISEIKKYTQG